MRIKRPIAVAVCILGAGIAHAQQKVTEETKIDMAMKAAFPGASAEWLSRLRGDQTLQTCSHHKDAPSEDLARAIAATERATIQYPADGKLMGDWKRGEQ